MILLGPTGCGKSHLAGGIANHIQRKPQKGTCESQQVAYLPPGEFGRLYQQAYEQDKLVEFRLAITRLHLLVLEDLHHLRLSQTIQRELRLSIDRLLTSGGMIVATSQQPLAKITSLEGGLRDRLSAGLTVCIKPPDTAARLELLQLAADRRGTKLDLNTARRLSQQVEGSVPQLFRALACLEQQRDQNRSRPINSTEPVCTAPNLQDRPRHAPTFSQKHVTMRQIITVVARYFSISQVLLRGNSRRQSIVHARGVAVYLARMLTDLSYAQIGHHLGNRDHTTTMHANRKLKRLFTTDLLTQECIDDLKRILTVV